MTSDLVARRVFFASALLLAFAYGLIADHYSLFPVPLIRGAKVAAEQLLEESAGLPWYYQHSKETASVQRHAAGVPAPGLRLISGLSQDERTLVRVMDVGGRIVHSWRIDWFKIWPTADHLSADLVPKSNAGLVHGVAVEANGDLIFNFSELGMVRLDPCGQVVWKVPYRTHHSLHVDESGNIWASGLITRQEKRPELPNYDPPFDDYTILKVSPSGKILLELSVAELLIKTDLMGLLYMSSIRNRSTRVSGDTLHLNDVETFPASMAPGTFSAGDVMISLRNINTILVFDPAFERVKFMRAGSVLRQHDPDFVDGDTLSVFDNNNLAIWGPETTPDAGGHYSRIVRLSASTRKVDVRFSGTGEEPFFTDIMGNHQLLPNGNTLLTESIAGRVVEIDDGGNMVWEYFNLVGDGLVGLIDDALVLPRELDEAFFRNASASCGARQPN